MKKHLIIAASILVVVVAGLVVYDQVIKTPDTETQDQLFDFSETEPEPAPEPREPAEASVTEETVRRERFTRPDNETVQERVKREVVTVEPEAEEPQARREEDMVEETVRQEPEGEDKVVERDEMEVKEKRAVQPDGRVRAERETRMEEDVAQGGVVRRKVVRDEESLTEDAVVTLDFIDDLCRFVVSRFHPRGGAKSPGGHSLDLTFEALNAHYGLKLTGLSHEAQRTDLAREQVLDYVMKPAIVRSLFRLYDEWLIQSLVTTAENTIKNYVVEGQTFKRRMTFSEAGAMLKLLADRLRTWASILAAAAETPEVFDLSGRFIRAGARVLAANADFQSILDDLRVNGQLPPNASDSPRVRAAAKTLKQAISAREQSRRQLVNIIHDVCGDACEDSKEILYIVQWAHRRAMAKNQSLEAIKRGAAEALRLADMMQARGRQLD
jgi:hypothetical protein